MTPSKGCGPVRFSASAMQCAALSCRSDKWPGLLLCSATVTSRTLSAFCPQPRCRWLEVALRVSLCLPRPSASCCRRCLDSVPTAPPQNVQAEAVDSTTIQFVWRPPPQQFVNGVNQGYKVRPSAAPGWLWWADLRAVGQTGHPLRRLHLGGWSPFILSLAVTRTQKLKGSVSKRVAATQRSSEDGL